MRRPRGTGGCAISIASPPAEPNGPRSRPIGLVVTIVVSLLVLGGIGALFWAQGYRAPVGTEVAQADGTATVDGQTLPHVLLHFDTYPDSTGTVDGVAIHPGGNPSWPAYGPTNDYQVPAHALVTVVVRQYDSGGSLNNPWFATVRGTVGGTETVDGKVVHSINPNDVGHTFTLRAMPGTDPGFFVNAPLPAVGGSNQSDDGSYHTVVFSFVSGSAGLYAWNCEFPCGQMVAGFGGVMNAYGFMSGFVDVV